MEEVDELLKLEDVSDAFPSKLRLASKAVVRRMERPLWLLIVLLRLDIGPLIIEDPEMRRRGDGGRLIPSINP